MAFLIPIDRLKNVWRLRLTTVNFQKVHITNSTILPYDADDYFFGRLILHFLIPCKLLSGIYPQDTLLKKYGLVPTYGPLINSIKTGNIKKFMCDLGSIENMLLKIGTFLCFESLIFLVYRNLFKIIYVVTDKNSKIPFEIFRCGLSISQGNDCNSKVEINEVEHIFTVLISKNIIKGYISHEKAVAVLSQSDAFPKKFYLYEN